MGTSRRFFLGALAGALLDPERLLWVPREKTIFIPETVKVREVRKPAFWLAKVQISLAPGKYLAEQSEESLTYVNVPNGSVLKVIGKNEYFPGDDYPAKDAGIIGTCIECTPVYGYPEEDEETETL